MAGTVKIAIEQRGAGVAVARVTGRLDFAAAQEARGQFGAAIAAGGRTLIVDLGRVEFVDSAGLGSLIGGMRAARQAGGDLHIANPTDQVKTLLSLTSLDRVLKVYPTVEGAIGGVS